MTDIKHRRQGQQPWFCTYVPCGGSKCEVWDMSPMRKAYCKDCRCLDYTEERKEYIRER